MVFGLVDRFVPVVVKDDPARTVQRGLSRLAQFGEGVLRRVRASGDDTQQGCQQGGRSHGVDAI